ncbi:MAG: hypothetical protein RLZZ127_9 [Planctomycetota bacterium]|jgi:opacity protein-like surface antigen
MLRLIPILAAAAALPALELVERDLGIAVEVPPTDYDFTLERPGQSGSGSDAFDSATAVWLRGCYAFTGPGDRHGPLLGAGLGVEMDSLPTGSRSLYAGELSGGWGVAITDSLSAHALLRLQAGMAQLDLDASGAAPAFSASGMSVGYGAELGVSYALSERVVLTADAGWRQASEDLSGDGVDVTLEPAGPVIGLGLWWRLSSRPWRLE